MNRRVHVKLTEVKQPRGKGDKAAEPVHPEEKDLEAEGTASTRL